MTKFVVKKFNGQKNDIFGQRGSSQKIKRLSLNIILLGLIVFVGMSYLYYMNRTATGGFDIKGLENQIEILNKGKTQLELKAAELQSLSNIEAASQTLQMVATTEIKYLPAVGSAVAVR